MCGERLPKSSQLLARLYGETRSTAIGPGTRHPFAFTSARASASCRATSASSHARAQSSSSSSSLAGNVKRTEAIAGHVAARK